MTNTNHDSGNEAKNLGIPSTNEARSGAGELDAAPSFTPGPWETVDRRSAPLRNILIVGADGSHVAQAEGVPTLDRRFRWDSAETTAADARALANAYLIAAAPALYAAALAALPTILTYIEEVGGCDHSVGICCCDMVAECEQLEAALALATGNVPANKRDNNDTER